VISPQFGHGNFADSVRGAIILWHDEHNGIAVTAAVFSLMLSMPHGNSHIL